MRGSQTANTSGRSRDECAARNTSSGSAGGRERTPRGVIRIEHIGRHMAATGSVRRHALINGSGGDVDVRQLLRIRNRVREAARFSRCRSFPLCNTGGEARRGTDAQDAATATDGSPADTSTARTHAVATAAVATAALRGRLRLPRFRHVVLFVLVEATCFLVPFLVQLIEDRLGRRLTLGIALLLERCQISRTVGVHNRSVTINSKSQRIVLSRRIICTVKQALAEVGRLCNPVVHRLA